MPEHYEFQGDLAEFSKPDSQPKSARWRFSSFHAIVQESVGKQHFRPRAMWVDFRN